MLKSNLQITSTLLLGVATLSGCSVNPTVRYVEASSVGEAARQPRLIDSFYRQKNELTIEFKPVDAAGKKAAAPLTVTNRRLEDTTRRIMMIGADPFWSRTTINLTKVPDTDLIASASSEVVDRRAEIVTSVGSVLKVILPVAMGVTGGPGKPKCNSLLLEPCSWALGPETTERKDLIEAAPGLTVNWGDVPETAVPVEDPAYKEFLSKPQKGLFYSACREVALSYVIADSVNRTIYSWRGKVADPNFVEFVAFPKSGQLEFHNQCGVSVKSVKDTTVTTDVLITTAVTQAVAIKEALDKAQEAKDAADKKAAGK
ncbi:hypothetical protein [Pseudomonas sp. NPDC087639]|uniref:hypothetical protein n=1 Tax=Pseudomonas sp. NPDC087639 TaxID=3364445 RepID=UPI0037F93CB5